MFMLILTILLMAVAFLFLSAFNARYCFRFLAHRFYTVGELSDEFRVQFASQLAECALPCKRFISSRALIANEGWTDTRPIIYAAGEIYINEDICKHFSPGGFAAGLAYEQAHHDSGYYMYQILMGFIIFGGLMPLIAILNTLLQPLVAYGEHPYMFVSLCAYIVNFLYVRPLLQFMVAFCCMIPIEFAFGAAVVNLYARSGHDLKSLLRYLQYVESHGTLGVNQLFNISSNRKRCEKLLEEK